jgi:quercetin dioxygenase-like cupin family protein
MKVKRWTNVQEQVAEGVDGVTVRWVIGEEDNAPHFAMRVFDVQPGHNTPYHNHWWEHEVFVLDGDGVVASAQGETPIASGSVILVEKDEMHQFRNTGDGVLRFICLIPWPWLEGMADQHASQRG